MGPTDRAAAPLALAPAEVRQLGYHLVDRLVEHVEALDDLPPVRVGAPDVLKEAVAACPDGPSDPHAVIDELFDVVLAHGQLGTHPRFFARIGSPSNLVSALTDFAAAGVNAFAGSWAGGSGPTAVELAVVDWLREWMGMPPGTEGTMVSGGSVGNLTALAVAARARLDGARAQATGYTSVHAHASIARAWSVLGLPPQQLRVLPADTCHRLTAARVAEAVRRDRADGLQPFCVAATAGNTSTGAVDELDQLARLCEDERLWFHVDGCYGGPARLCEGGRAALAGIEHADSLTLDPHKWLFQPYEAGCVLVREAGLLEHAFALDGAYLRDTAGDQVNLRDRGLQLSRGSRALKLWASVRVFGLDAFRAGVAHGIALAEHAEAVLRQRPAWEVVSPAQLGIVCFRRAEGGDALNDRIVRLAVADGFAAPSSTVLDGRTAIRLCTINPRTTPRDVEATIDRLEQLAGD